jgi:hypothetical protein
LTLSALRQQLKQGLAGHVLDDLSTAVMDRQSAGQLAVVRTLVSLVASELATIWDGPVEAEKANDLTRRFGTPLDDALAAIESGNAAAAASAAENLARAYLSWV